MASDNIRVFIGSGEASLLERKALIYSIRKNTNRKVDIYVFNGTHNAIELNDEDPELAPMSLKVKYHNITEFSNYRFLIPQICNHEGKAIFVDSDTICLGDIGELFDTPLGDYDLLAKKNAYKKAGEDQWGLSVSLYDCKKCNFNPEQYFDEIDRGLYSYTDLHQLSPKFLSYHNFKIGEINPNWNVFDNCDAQTKLIHYTDLYSQPWKTPGHKFEKLWFKYFNEAREAGFIKDKDIELTLKRSYARRDLVSSGSESLKYYIKGIISALKKFF